MKTLRLILIAIVIAAGLLMPAAPAFAANVLNDGGPNSPCGNPSAQGTPAVCGDNGAGKGNPLVGSGGLLTHVVSLLAYLAGALAVIMAVVSGIRMITSAGDTAGFNSARTGLIYSVVGLVVALLAQATVTFILGKL